MSVNEYELTVIVRPDLDDAATYAIFDKLEEILAEGGGQLLHRDDWGKRKLAYAISRHLKGHYALICFLSEPTLISEFERRMRNIDSVLRFLTVKVGDAVDVEARLRDAAEILARREEEERARAAAEAEAEALRNREAEQREAEKPAADPKSETTHP